MIIANSVEKRFLFMAATLLKVILQKTVIIGFVNSVMMIFVIYLTGNILYPINASQNQRRHPNFGSIR